MAPSSLSPAVVGVVLAAALLHATWNAIVAGVGDRLTGFALIGVVDVVAGGVLVLVAAPLRPDAWPHVVASAALHVVYSLLLWWSYQLGEFSQAYPLARGVAPLTVTVVSLAVLGRALPAVQLAGVLVICAGLIALVVVGGRPERVLPVAAAAVTGFVIAAYTVVDALGVVRGPLLAYVGWLFLLQGPPLVAAAVAVHRRGVGRRLRAYAVPGLVGGVVSLAAYGLVLAAQTSGALAPVAALRESSIVFGAIIGAVFLGERLGARRALAAVVVLAGIVLVSL